MYAYDLKTTMELIGFFGNSKLYFRFTFGKNPFSVWATTKIYHFSKMC